MMVIKRPSLRQLSWLLGGSLVLCALFWLWLAVQQQEATLAIRPVGQGVSMPDGFSVWHHLDANGLSSTPPPRARRRKRFSVALCHMVILLPCWRTITRPPPGYPVCATRLTGSGKLPPYCVFYAVWWFPAFVTMLKPAGINAFPFTIGNGYILRVYPQTMEGTIHETPHRSASGPDFT